jgi:hypothetical protein
MSLGGWGGKKKKTVRNTVQRKYINAYNNGAHRLGKITLSYVQASGGASRIDKIELLEGHPLPQVPARSLSSRRQQCNGVSKNFQHAWRQLEHA